MKAEKCACPLTAEADSLQRPVNGYQFLYDELYICPWHVSVG